MKQLKRWRGENRERLIEGDKPRWQDPAAYWYPANTQGPSTAYDLSKARDHAPLGMTMRFGIPHTVIAVATGSLACCQASNPPTMLRT